MMPGSRDGHPELGADNHYKRLVGLNVLSSLFSGISASASQSKRGSILQYPSPPRKPAGFVGQEVSQVGAQVVRKDLNVQPTIKIPVGCNLTCE